MRLVARGQVLLTTLLVNAKNVDPHSYVITDGAFQVGCNGWSISSWLQWLAAKSIRILTFGAYKLLMKQMMMSLSIGYLEGYFSGYPFKL